MARRLTAPFRSQRAFTLIELLVVIAIIGVLAAIALPIFLGKRNNAEDADAKANARNLVSQVESCFTPNEDFQQCTTPADLDGAPGIDWGSAPGQVEVVGAQKESYTVVATSKATTGAQNRKFTITRSTHGQNDRTCSPDGGGCRAGSW